MVAARFGLGLQAPPVADSAQQGQAQRSLTSSDYFAKKEAGTARGRPKQSARKSRINTINKKTNEYRGVAQLVARLLWEQDVAGSNPVTSTRIPLRSRISEEFFIFSRKKSASEKCRNRHKVRMMWFPFPLKSSMILTAAANENHSEEIPS